MEVPNVVMAAETEAVEMKVAETEAVDMKVAETDPLKVLTETEAESETETETKVLAEAEEETETETEERKQMAQLMKDILEPMKGTPKKKLTGSEMESEMEIKARMETESDVEREICKHHLKDQISPIMKRDYESPPEEEEVRPLQRWYNFGFFDPLSLPHLPPERKKAHIWSFSNNFSSSAFSSLSNGLFGEKERNTMKSVYMCVTRSGFEGRPSCNMSWIIVNPNKQHTVGQRKVVSLSCIDDDMRNPKSGFPSELSVLTGYGCAIWSSRFIFIAGGKCGEFSSNKIFVYDTISKEWRPQPMYMGLKRGEKPTVVIADDKLFIFGGAEEEDINGVESFCLPSGGRRSTPVFPYFAKAKIVFHAVYPKRKQILLWLDSSSVFSYNYQEGHLAEYDISMSIPLGPQLINKAVVFEDILFWHNHGTIFAHDLMYHATVLTYTLPRTGFSKVLFSDNIPSSFLAHIGKGKLCLFYQVENHICYFTFSVQVSQCPQATIPLLVLGDSGILQNSIGCDIMHALEVST